MAEEWTTKHAPKTVAQFLGSHTGPDALLKWLRTWAPGKTRGALITGTTGCGKTLLAHLVCKEAGISGVVELNTMRKRTKKAISDIEQAFHTKGIPTFFKKSQRPGAVIVDDVDVCDQGGLAQIVAFVRRSSVPVICTAGAGYNKALKSLADCTLPVKLYKPSPDQIATFLMGIVRIEYPNRPPAMFTMATARALVSACDCDVRQCIMELRMCTRTPCSMVARGESGTLVDRPIGLFDTIPKLFRAGPVSVAETERMYQTDKYMIPAMVAENWLRSELSMERAPEIAEAVSLGDTLVRRAPAEVQGFFTTTAPCALTRSALKMRAEFPAALGQESKAKSRERELTDLARRITAGTARQTTMTMLAEEVVQGLRARYVDTMAMVVRVNAKAIPAVAKVMAEEMTRAGMKRDDWLLLAEEGTFPPAKPAEGVSTAAKSALTRSFTALNKGEPPAAKRARKADEEEEEQEIEEDFAN